MPNLTPEACELLHRLASDCRAKQKTYFETRKRSDLRTAKQAETVLDALLTKYTPSEEPTLFDLQD